MEEGWLGVEQLEAIPHATKQDFSSRHINELARSLDNYANSATIFGEL